MKSKSKTKSKKKIKLKNGDWVILKGLSYTAKRFGLDEGTVMVGMLDRPFTVRGINQEQLTSCYLENEYDFLFDLRDLQKVKH